MTAPDSRRLLDELAAILPPRQPEPRSLAELIGTVEALGVEAGRLAIEIAPHIEGAGPEMMAFLHRLGIVLRDLALAIEHAMTPVVRAAIAA